MQRRVIIVRKKLEAVVDVKDALRHGVIVMQTDHELALLMSLNVPHLDDIGLGDRILSVKDLEIGKHRQDLRHSDDVLIIVEHQRMKKHRIRGFLVIVIDIDQLSAEKRILAS